MSMDCENQYLGRVGATPLVPVRLRAEQPVIWCKLEFLHPSGSTKDRIARHILEKAMGSGRVKKGDRVVEASSGSSAIALALACAQFQLKFVAVMPDGVSAERIKIIRAYGGEIHLTDRAGGVSGAIAEAARIAAESGAFAPAQFENPDNPEAHRLHTAVEVLE
ncbi:MAG TPA: pyridoxal-phosphate dependent enzyme, partial [Tepidisphaeraceae bacterium]